MAHRHVLWTRALLFEALRKHFRPVSGDSEKVKFRFQARFKPIFALLKNSFLLSWAFQKNVSVKPHMLANWSQSVIFMEDRQYRHCSGAERQSCHVSGLYVFIRQWLSIALMGDVDGYLG